MPVKRPGGRNTLVFQPFAGDLQVSDGGGNCRRSAYNFSMSLAI
jgi:hypothetical protein